MSFRKTKNKGGFSLVEVLLAVAIFSLAITPIVTSIIYGQESTALSGALTRATFLASEGIEAVRNIRDENFSNLSDDTHGLAVSDGQWILSGSSDATEDYKREIIISTVDENTKKIDVNVAWKQNMQRDGLVNLTTYLTNWSAPTLKGGMLVYGDGESEVDAIRYKTFDPATGSWSEANNSADVDSGSTNKRLRAVKIYSSNLKNEKVMISRHYNGTGQFIYAQVYDGSAWGNVTNLSGWNANTFLDVQNFSGTYLSNGNFMVVYSDNTTIPKMKIWNGSNWSSSSSLSNLGAGQIPVYVDVENRVGSNEVMAAFFTQGSDVLTQYYSGSSWSSVVTHATSAPANDKKFMEFKWSVAEPNLGVLVYASGTNARRMSGRVWVANGTGGGSWGAARNSSNQSKILGGVALASRSLANEFHACNKDSGSPPSIRCFSASISGANRVDFSNPSNAIIANETDGGLQRSFHLGFSDSGNAALGVYSDRTNVPKFKVYDPMSSSWSANASNVATLDFSPGNFQAITLVPYEDGMDDIMILMSDDKQDVYSAVWDGTSQTIYASPAGKAFSRHGTAGSQNSDFWFDFTWDKF
jgi:prepilin-type N-terminal cleavage/methylation domain-containing protein